jgi:hypothetical protein
MYVYIRSEPGLWTVGFYGPEGTWHPESDHDSTDAAAERVHWLNGGEDGRLLRAKFMDHDEGEEVAP